MTDSTLPKSKNVSVFVTLALGMSLSMLSDLSSAAQGSGQFTVTATLTAGGKPALPKSTFCQTTSAVAFGALVTMVCATDEVVSVTPQAGAAPGVPTLGRAYQVVVSRTFAPGLSVSSSTSSESGMVSNTRMVQVDGQNYYELLVVW